MLRLARIFSLPTQRLYTPRNMSTYAKVSVPSLGDIQLPTGLFM